MGEEGNHTQDRRRQACHSTRFPSQKDNKASGSIAGGMPEWMGIIYILSHKLEAAASILNLLKPGDQISAEELCCRAHKLEFYALQHVLACKYYFYLLLSSPAWPWVDRTAAASR